MVDKCCNCQSVPQDKAICWPSERTDLVWNNYRWVTLYPNKQNWAKKFGLAKFWIKLAEQHNGDRDVVLWEYILRINPNFDLAVFEFGVSHLYLKFKNIFELSRNLHGGLRCDHDLSKRSRQTCSFALQISYKFWATQIGNTLFLFPYHPKRENYLLIFHAKGSSQLQI